METRKRKYPEQTMDSQSCCVTSLPTDMIIQVMACIASSSFADLFRSKLCCKIFKSASETDDIFRQILIPENKFPVVPWRVNDKAMCFLKRCIECGNPEALFREGMVDYFSRGKAERGIENLRAAVAKGHVEASYVYGIILLCLGGKSNKKLGFKLLNYVKISSSSQSSSRRKLTVGDCRKRAKSIIRQMWINNGLQNRDQEEEDKFLHPYCQSEIATSPAGWEQDADDVECEACSWAREAAEFCNIVQGYA